MPSNSRFLHQYSIEGSTVYFHSLTLELYDSPDSAPSHQEDEELLRTSRLRVEQDPGIVMGTLFLTTQCPRHCVYCFLQGVTEGDLTRREIDRVVYNLSSQGADLLLYGGEPLLKPELIHHTLDRVSGLPRTVNTSLATGGYPIEPSLASRLAQENTFIIISMDGSPEISRISRPYPGADSFREAEKTFHVLREAGCRVGISVTLSQWNIERMPEDFIWLLERFSPDDMGLNPWLHPLKGGVECPGQVSTISALQAVTSCMESTLEKGVYIEQLARRVRPFSRKSPRLKDCPSAGGRLVAVPGGIIGGCDCMTVCGDHGVSTDDNVGLREILESLRYLSPVNSIDCLSCPALGVCGGGCRYDALHSSGCLNGRREERCTFERGFLKWMIHKAFLKGRDSLLPKGGFRETSIPMPVATLIGENGEPL